MLQCSHDNGLFTKFNRRRLLLSLCSHPFTTPQLLTLSVHLILVQFIHTLTVGVASRPIVHGTDSPVNAFIVSTLSLLLSSEAS